MPVIGAHAAIELALPTGIDSGRVLAFSLRNQRTARDLVEEVAAAIGQVNADIFARYGALAHFTPSLYSYYPQGAGSRSMTPTKVEFKQADGIRSEVSGNMLPYKDFEESLEWTAAYLRDSLEVQTQADVTLLASRWRGRVDYDILSRALSKTENALGSGYDVPWSIGTGTNVNFLPPEYGAYVFDTTHTHFLGVTGAVSATTCETALDKVAEELRHHGHTGTITALVSEADIASYQAIGNAKWVRLVPQGVQAVGGNSASPVFVSQQELEGIPGEVIGMFLSKWGPRIIVRTHERIPTAYLFGTKSYGVDNVKNGLAIREHPSRGFGLFPNVMVTSSINPELERVRFEGGHGVGVNNRTNGIAIQINSASYNNPTIS